MKETHVLSKNTTEGGNDGGFFNPSTLGSDKNTKIFFLPLNKEDVDIRKMMNTTFKKKEFDLTSAVMQKDQPPVLFNLYSHTRAVPFTSEKTKIPITHRVGSFYSLSVQNYIIDNTNKKLKALADEYFQKYKTINLDLPADENEEYLYACEVVEEYENKASSIVPISKRVKHRKNVYKKYLQHIEKYIPDEFISEIKGVWMENIVRLSMRAYNIVDNVSELILRFNMNYLFYISNYSNFLFKP